jgi:hypothetical protein
MRLSTSVITVLIGVVRRIATITTPPKAFAIFAAFGPTLEIIANRKNSRHTSVPLFINDITLSPYEDPEFANISSTSKARHIRNSPSSAPTEPVA